MSRERAGSVVAKYCKLVESTVIERGPDGLVDRPDIESKDASKPCRSRRAAFGWFCAHALGVCFVALTVALVAGGALMLRLGSVAFGEALRPSSFSLVTLSGLSIGRLIGANIIVEQIFSLPGLGPMVVDAAQKSDYPLVQGAVLVIAVAYIAANLLVDVLYGILDPRVRRAHG